MGRAGASGAFAGRRTEQYGTLDIDAAFPALEVLGKGAFLQRTRADAVRLRGPMLHLRDIGEGAFWYADLDALEIEATQFPLLQTIGRDAFEYAGAVGQTLRFTGPLLSLESIGKNSFRFYRGMVMMTGEAPRLLRFGERAMNGIGGQISGRT